MVAILPSPLPAIDHRTPESLVLARRYSSPNLPNVPVPATVCIVVGVLILVLAGTWLCTRRMAARDRRLTEARALRDQIALSPSSQASPHSSPSTPESHDSERPVRALEADSDVLPRYEKKDALPTYAEAYAEQVGPM